MKKQIVYPTLCILLINSIVYLNPVSAQQVILFEKFVDDSLKYNVTMSGIGNLGSNSDKAGIISFQIDAIKSKNGKLKMPIILRNATTSLFKDLADSLQRTALVFSENYNWFLLGLRPSIRLKDEPNMNIYLSTALDISFNGFKIKGDSLSARYQSSEVFFNSIQIVAAPMFNLNIKLGQDKGNLSIAISGQFNYFSLFRLDNKPGSAIYSDNHLNDNQPSKSDFLGLGVKSFIQFNDFSLYFDYVNVKPTSGNSKIEGITGNQINVGIMASGKILKF